MSFNESQHPRGRTGRFIHGDQNRPEAGQVVGKPQPPKPFVVRQGNNTQFRVLREVDLDIAAGLMARRAETLHAAVHRRSRLAQADPGEAYRAFAITRDGKPENVEVHVVTRNAEVYVYSARTARLITMLYARPGQVVRYFGGERVDEDVMNKARDNVAQERFKR